MNVPQKIFFKHCLPHDDQRFSLFYLLWHHCNDNDKWKMMAWSIEADVIFQCAARQTVLFKVETQKNKAAKCTCSKKKIGSSSSNCCMTQQNQFGTRKGCYLPHQLQEQCWNHSGSSGYIIIKIIMMVSSWWWIWSNNDNKKCLFTLYLSRFIWLWL